MAIHSEIPSRIHHGSVFFLYPQAQCHSCTNYLESESIESQYRQETGIVSLKNQTQSLVASLADVENQERLVVAQLREARTKGGPASRRYGRQQSRRCLCGQPGRPR